MPRRRSRRAGFLLRAWPGLCMMLPYYFHDWRELSMHDLAVVNFGPERYSVELREIPRATIGNDEVLLEVQAVGVCGSDLHMWTAQQSWPMRYPVVLGHEFCGVICEVGRG